MGSRLEQKSSLVRKRIEDHSFDDEAGEEYQASKFGGFSDYFRRKKIKLQNLDAQLRADSDKPAIFAGVVCHVNGYTQPSLQDLHVMVVEHGGGFIQYLDGKTMVTHIIASQLTPKKKEEFRRYRIVKPAWIVDSVREGKLLPWHSYRVIEEGAGQKVLGFESNGQVISQASNVKKVQSYREQTDASWYTSQMNALAGSAAKAKDERSEHATQTITPIEDIEDDEYPLPSISSSMEEAMGEVARLVDERPEPRDSHRVGHVEPNHKLETPPPTSPPLPPQDDAEPNKTFAVPAEAVTSIQKNKEKTGLRSRQGSQEPDYSMAVVRDSEVLRSVSPTLLANMTAEEHNALLLSDPKIRKSTVVNPEFLEQYYRESRLHHLSTWKADLKSQLQALAAERSSSQKSKRKTLPGQRRYVMHVDFDSFFAAVSLKKCPQYKDKPAVVAHGGGSGSEIASCNYPARAFGISNGMWMKRAQDLCPHVKILPYDFPAYEDASRKFYDAILATGGIVQSVSIDEALVDISALCIAASGQDGIKRSEGAVNREQNTADEIAGKLRDEVFNQTGCAVSVGIGANILQAKVALRKAKPAGQYQLKPEEVLDFIGQLEVQKLPGIAWSMGRKLEEIGVKLVKDIREVTRERLMNTLGPKTGEKVWEYARGIDKTEVGDQTIRKSVSAEVNWGVRFENSTQVDEFMHGLCGELNKRLLKERVKGKQLTMKVMKRAADAPLDPPKHLGHGKCDSFSKSIQLGVATNDPTVITKEAITMIRSFNFSPGELRGIGIQMQKLELIKSGVERTEQGSQKRLQFKMNQLSKEPADVLVATKPAEKPPDDPIQDDTRTPTKQRVADVNKPSTSLKPVYLSSPSKKPLNVMGTQFVLPTQVDPNVLAELPEGIRAKLAKYTPDKPAVTDQTDVVNPVIEAPATLHLPPQSQIDPTILEALPDDVRKEILGFYATVPRKRGEQALLPQSPRKNRTLPPPPRQPVKRGRGRPRGSTSLAGRLKAAARDENSTLTQSNFVARPRLPTPTVDDTGARTAVEVRAIQEDEPFDPEVLAALPADLREELLAQQRQTRLQRTGGIDLSLHAKSATAKKRLQQQQQRQDPLAVEDDRRIILPPHPAKPTFTSQRLSELPDLRGALSAWFREFREEGPYEEDVDALAKYLRAVVLEERDWGKAVAGVKWLVWVVGNADEDEGKTDEGSLAWRRALEGLQSSVREAVAKRGIQGKITF